MTEESDELRRLHVDIFAILVGSKDPMGIFRIAKEYEDEEGRSIPYQKCGFRSLEALLDAHPRLYSQMHEGKKCYKARAEGNAAHIVNLVNRQQTKKSRKRGGRSGGQFQRSFSIRPQRSATAAFHRHAPSRSTFAGTSSIKPLTSVRSPLSSSGASSASRIRSKLTSAKSGPRRVQPPLHYLDDRFEDSLDVVENIQTVAPVAQSDHLTLVFDLVLESTIEQFSECRAINPRPSTSVGAAKRATIKDVLDGCTSVLEDAFPSPVPINEMPMLIQRAVGLDIDPMNLFSKTWDEIFQMSAFQPRFVLNSTNIAFTERYILLNGLKFKQRSPPQTVAKQEDHRRSKIDADDSSQISSLSSADTDEDQRTPTYKDSPAKKKNAATPMRKFVRWGRNAAASWRKLVKSSPKNKEEENGFDDFERDETSDEETNPTPYVEPKIETRPTQTPTKETKGMMNLFRRSLPGLSPATPRTTTPRKEAALSEVTETRAPPTTISSSRFSVPLQKPSSSTNETPKVVAPTSTIPKPLASRPYFDPRRTDPVRVEPHHYEMFADLAPKHGKETSREQKVSPIRQTTSTPSTSRSLVIQIEGLASAAPTTTNIRRRVSFKNEVSIAEIPLPDEDSSSEISEAPAPETLPAPQTPSRLSGVLSKTTTTDGHTIKPRVNGFLLPTPFSTIGKQENTVDIPLPEENSSCSELSDARSIPAPESAPQQTTSKLSGVLSKAAPTEGSTITPQLNGFLRPSPFSTMINKETTATVPPVSALTQKVATMSVSSPKKSVSKREDALLKAKAMWNTIRAQKDKTEGSNANGDSDLRSTGSSCSIALPKSLRMLGANAKISPERRKEPIRNSVSTIFEQED